MLQGAEVLVHLPEQELQFAARHMEFLLGLDALLDLILRLELRPQSLEGGLLSLPALQLLLQILQTTNIRDGGGASWWESEHSTLISVLYLLTVSVLRCCCRALMGVSG